MTEASTTSADQDPIWRMRWILLASMIVVFAALGLLILMHHAYWNWPLFFWGVAVGLAGLIIITALVRLVSRRQETTADQRLLLRRRLTIYTFGWVAVGLICGSASAAFDQAWIDVGAALYVAVTLGAGLLIFRQRRSLT